MGLYSLALCALSILLLLYSLASFYLASILIIFYLLPSLFTLSPYFVWMPYSVLTTGLLYLCASITGIASIAARYRGYDSKHILAMSHSIILGIAFPLLLAAVFSSLQLSSELDNPGLFQMVCTRIKCLGGKSHKIGTEH